MALRRSSFVVSVLTVALVAACGRAEAAADVSDGFVWSAASGVSANCDDGLTATYSPLGRYDIDRDGDQDEFILFRCSKGKDRVSDQVEMFDGGSDHHHPHRLWTGPLLHQARGISVHCVEFHANTVYIADETVKQSGRWHVARYGTWDEKKKEMRFGTRQDLTVPCVNG